MYNDDFDIKISDKAAKKTKMFSEALMENYSAKDPVKKIERYHYNEEVQNAINTINNNNSIKSRFQSFSESVRQILVTESLYKIYYEAMDPRITSDPSNLNIMRRVVNEYVNDNGYTNILSRMHGASVPMNLMHDAIVNSTKAILEAADKEDPDTFVISQDMKDDFFNALDYSDTEQISQAISDRVADAMVDFINSNNKDHEDITAALKSAQEKIDNSGDEDATMHETYEYNAKQKIFNIKNAPKGIFHNMVSSICESAISNADNYRELFTENHLDMEKIVNRTRILYTFMEMLNTSRLDTITRDNINEIIEDLRK